MTGSVLTMPQQARDMRNSAKVPATRPDIVHKPGSRCVAEARTYGKRIVMVTIAQAITSGCWCRCWGEHS
jgi:hypothetical protein